MAKKPDEQAEIVKLKQITKYSIPMKDLETGLSYWLYGARCLGLTPRIETSMELYKMFYNFTNKGDSEYYTQNSTTAITAEYLQFPVERINHGEWYKILSPLCREKEKENGREGNDY